jgi:hypothetical protein
MVKNDILIQEIRIRTIVADPDPGSGIVIPDPRQLLLFDLFS